jgi:hypothetical protein
MSRAQCDAGHKTMRASAECQPHPTQFPSSRPDLACVWRQSGMPGRGRVVTLDPDRFQGFNPAPTVVIRCSFNLQWGFPHCIFRLPVVGSPAFYFCLPARLRHAFPLLNCVPMCQRRILSSHCVVGGGLACTPFRFLRSFLLFKQSKADASSILIAALMCLGSGSSDFINISANILPNIASNSISSLEQVA